MRSAEVQQFEGQSEKLAAGEKASFVAMWSAWTKCTSP